MVIASSVTATFKGIPSDLVNMDTFWYHSVTCGVTARLLASSVDSRERFFIAGLLHGVGRLILFSQFPKESAKVLGCANQGVDAVIHAERKIFGFTHAQLGAELLRQWRLPLNIWKMVELQLAPMKDETHKYDACTLCAAVNIANFIQPCTNQKTNSEKAIPAHAFEAPVGKDQEQHMELARDIAHRFNTQVGKEYFVLPEPLYTRTPKIRSTADPSRKMSKSAGEKHYISVFADEATGRRQIKSAVTDSGDTPAGMMAEGVENLFELIYASGWTTEYEQLMDAYRDGQLKYVDLKQVTADALVSMINGFTTRKKELSADKRKLKDQIRQSSSEIRTVARETLREVKDLIGLLNV